MRDDCLVVGHLHFWKAADEVLLFDSSEPEKRSFNQSHIIIICGLLECCIGLEIIGISGK